MRAISKHLIGILGSFLLCIPHTTATSLVVQSVEELTTEANWVGRVQIQAQKVVKKKGFHFTVFEAKILEVFKGSGRSDDLIEVEIPGGELDGLRLSVSGISMLRKGDEYILFLDRKPIASQDRSQAFSVSSERPGLEGWATYRIQNKDGYRSVTRAGEANLLRSTSAGFRSMHGGHGELVAIEEYSHFVDRIFSSID